MPSWSAVIHWMWAANVVSLPEALAAAQRAAVVARRREDGRDRSLPLLSLDHTLQTREKRPSDQAEVKEPKAQRARRARS